MFFSICIAVYNAEKYLRDGVESILSQDFDDYEIILINDASTDNSGAVCDSLASEHPGKVRVIHHFENMGSLLARRAFYYAAKGEWLLAADADDKLNDGALKKLYSLISEYDCDLILYDLDCYHMNGSVEKFTVELKDRYVYCGDEKKLVYEQIQENNYLNSLCTKAIHRSLIDYEVDYMPWKGMSFGEDIFQSYPIFDRAERILYLKESLYSYIKRTEASTTKWHDDWYKNRRTLWLRDCEYRKKWQMGEETEEKAVSRYIKTMVSYLDRQYLRTPDFKMMVEWYENYYRDGDIAKCLENAAKLNKRYRLYAKSIVKHRFRFLHFNQKLFFAALKKKKKSVKR